jgi:hypothetical protein
LGGLKGGRSRSKAKLAACKRNGFQRTAPAEKQPPDLQPGCSCIQPATPQVPAVLIVSRPQEEK